MEDDSRELIDYKFLTFNGKPEMMFIATDRQKKNSQTKFDYFDMEGNHLDIEWVYPNAEVTPQLPDSFEQMKSLAEKVAKNTTHARIDFYEVNTRVYFGEITLYHQSSIAPIFPEEWDYYLGSLINLKSVTNNNGTE